MTALEAVAVHLPPTLVPIEGLAEPLDLNEMQVKLFRRFHKLHQIRFAPESSTADLLLATARELDELRGNEHRVRYVLYGRAMPVADPYSASPLHEVCRALGLEHAVAFTVTQQSCASGLLAIDLACKLLATTPPAAAVPTDPATADPAPTDTVRTNTASTDTASTEPPLALVLTGEKTFTRHARLIPATSVFGEAAAACLVSADGPATDCCPTAAHNAASSTSPPAAQSTSSSARTDRYWPT